VTPGWHGFPGFLKISGGLRGFWNRVFAHAELPVRGWGSWVIV
jgi:hypothetical protein